MSGFTSAAAAAPARDYRVPASPVDREQMILDHLPQVRFIARRIYEQLPGLMCLEDLVSTGTVGLIAAIDRFDPSQGVKLRTYAEFKIRGAILDSLRSLDWAPRSQRRRARALLDAANEVAQRKQANASVEEIADEMGITIDECHALMRDARRVSFEPLDTTGADCVLTGTVRQLAASGADTEPGKELENQQLRTVLAEAIRRMPRQERIVLSLMFHEELSLREISRVMGLHESRVSQIKIQALARMRTLMERSWPKRGSSATGIEPGTCACGSDQRGRGVGRGIA